MSEFLESYIKNKNEIFIEKAVKVHGDKYDYSLINYITNTDKIKIICKTHGEFTQIPANHLMGANCPECSKESRRKLKTKTNEDFINDCKKLHGDIYDYTKTVYISSKHNIIVGCPIHGDFEILADNHRRKDGCCRCKNEKRVSKLKNDFIKNSKIIHNNKYDYSLVDYKNRITKVTIKCNKHGYFEQTPNNHLQGNGCNSCNLENRNDNRINYDKFVELASIIHQNKYTYNEENFLSTDENMLITCKIHGDFTQKPRQHLKNIGCKKCISEKTKQKLTNTTEQFIQKAEKIHKNRYDYSLVEYKHSREKVKIICDVHGIFKQAPVTHLKGSGCRKCSNLINIYKKEDYVKLSKTAILYVVLLEFEEESFIKIGKTKNSVKERLSNSISEYKYTTLHEYTSESGDIFDLEIKLHNKYYSYKYYPKIVFAGHTECYRLDLPIQEIVNEYHN